MPASASAVPRKGADVPLDIVDIRAGQVDFDMKGEIMSMMDPSNAQRALPTMLLYDERGLQLFEKVFPSHASYKSARCVIGIHRPKQVM